MKIIGSISSIGGIGNTVFSSCALKNIKNSIFIDSNNGFRTIDLLEDEDEVIYDLFDFSIGMDIDDVIYKGKIDFIPASQTRTHLDFNFENLKENINKLNYDYVLIDIPRDISYINSYIDICDEFIVYGNESNISLRNIDKISFMILQKRLNKRINVVFNKISNNINLNEDRFKIIENVNLSYRCQIPYICDFSIDSDEFKNYIWFIEKIIKGEELSFNEISIDKKEKKGFLGRFFNV